MISFFICAAQSQAEALRRPPQYVLMAFDGSESISMWKATREFAKEMQAQGKPLHFTYFISGVYYVERQYKRMYTEPLQGVGVSAIGWGEDDADLEARYDQTNLAFQEGHDIGSHANAHFSGADWTTDQWISEFTQFDHIIFDFLKVNQLQPTKMFPHGWLFNRRNMIGFRAPLLDWNKGTWAALKKFGFRYDTSQVKESDDWPRKNPTSGAWNFALADLVIAGTGKKTLSMDYNFYYTQSGGEPDPDNAQIYEEQMYQTYIQYFQSNYAGNRAPINIGHHFSRWNNGAYWNAMQRFARAVCGLPEVKCVTYRELADFMDQLTPDQIAQYQDGDFPKRDAPELASASGANRTFDLAVQVNPVKPGVFDMQLTGADVAELRRDPSVKMILNSGENTRTVSPIRAHNKVVLGDQSAETPTIQMRVYKNGREILSHTRDIANPGTSREQISAAAREDRALMGDLPEAHADEFKEDAGIRP